MSSEKNTIKPFRYSLMLCLPFALAACDAQIELEMADESETPSVMSGDTISGLNMPNPNPTVTRNWGIYLPAASGVLRRASISIRPMATSSPTSAAAQEILVREFRSTATPIP